MHGVNECGTEKLQGVINGKLGTVKHWFCGRLHQQETTAVAADMRNIGMCHKMGLLRENGGSFVIS